LTDEISSSPHAVWKCLTSFHNSRFCGNSLESTSIAASQPSGIWRYTQVRAKKEHFGWQMQIFIAEVTKFIDQAAFEQSWDSDSAIDRDFQVTFVFAGRRISANVRDFQVTFVFAGRRISANVECRLDRRWQSDSFRRVFSSAVRRVDRSCNVKWL
jgi:hypothetical protein